MRSAGRSVLEVRKDVLFEHVQHLPRFVGSDTGQQRVEDEPAAAAQAVGQGDCLFGIEDLILANSLHDVVEAAEGVGMVVRR